MGIRTRAEINADSERDRRNKSTANLQAPCNISNVVDSQVSAKAQEDTEGGPHLNEKVRKQCIK
jgi:hypothetical protein